MNKSDIHDIKFIIPSKYPPKFQYASKEAFCPVAFFIKFLIVLPGNFAVFFLEAQREQSTAAELYTAMEDSSFYINVKKSL